VREGGGGRRLRGPLPLLGIAENLSHHSWDAVKFWSKFLAREQILRGAGLVNLH